MTRPEVARNVRPVLSARMLAAVPVLAFGGTNAEAGAAAGVSDRTVRRWRAVPAFVAEVRAMTAEALDAAARTLAAGALEAARYASGVAADPTQPDGVRLAATRLVLTLAPQLRDACELEARLSALERAVGLAALETGEGTE